MLAQSVSGELYRTLDAGGLWELLEARPSVWAASPEFAQDGTLLGAFWTTLDERQRTELRLSRNRGHTWQSLTVLAPDTRVHWLGLAPLFDTWGVAFLWDSHGVLHRSSDGGVTWQTVLSTATPDYDLFAASAPLVFAPGDEQRRHLYLVATHTELGDEARVVGELYRSQDGGQTWRRMVLPSGVQATSIALSPHYLQDRLLFVGAADGRVVALDSGQLVEQ
jgi:photosystem II stability/assembly factor-like uncharacterized protein